MTAEILLALMLTMKCHTMTVDIPERRETVVQTVCVKVVPDKKPVTNKVTYRKKKKYRSRKRKGT